MTTTTTAKRSCAPSRFSSISLSFVKLPYSQAGSVGPGIDGNQPNKQVTNLSRLKRLSHTFSLSFTINYFEGAVPWSKLYIFTTKFSFADILMIFGKNY